MEMTLRLLAIAAAAIAAMLLVAGRTASALGCAH
jgi:hypothetical protein